MLLSHIIPYYPILSHIIPYYPILSHIISYYLIYFVDVVHFFYGLMCVCVCVSPLAVFFAKLADLGVEQAVIRSTV